MSLILSLYLDGEDPSSSCLVKTLAHTSRSERPEIRDSNAMELMMRISTARTEVGMATNNDT